jgi:hypothetical protein
MLWMCVALLLLPQAAPSPSPTPSPAERPRRLRLDIEKHVDSVMRDRGGRPSFEDTVEVLGRAPDVALAEQLAEFDLECGPTLGPPTHVESREFRPHPAPFLDLAALSRALAGAISQPGPPRYFLYRVRGTDGPDYLLRDGPLTIAPGQQPTTAFELVASFPDLGSAVHGFRRMERGFGSTERADTADPAPPWATTPCRLRPRR